MLSQILFMDELDAVFGTTARTSLQGQTIQAIKTGAKAATSPTGAARDVAIAIAARAKNQDAAFKAIRELLRD